MAGRFVVQGMRVRLSRVAAIAVGMVACLPAACFGGNDAADESDAGDAAVAIDGGSSVRSDDAGSPMGMRDAHVATGEDTLEPWRSGARLRARIVDGGEGARYFEGWFDTELEMDCRFRLHPDGLARCEPEHSAGEELVLFYADAACTQGISLTTEPVGSLITLHAGVPLDACDDASADQAPSVLRVEGPAPKGDTMYFRDGSACTSLELPGFSEDAVLLVPIDLDMLAVAEVHEAGSPIGARWLAGADGSRESVTLTRDDGGACELFESPSTSARCLPRDVWIAEGSEISLDATCSDPLIVGWHGPTTIPGGGSCGGEDLVIAPVASCPGQRGGAGRPSAFYPASWLTTRAAHEFDGMVNGCASVDIGDLTYLDTSEPIAEDTLTAVEVAERGTGQLRAHFGMSSDGRLARKSLVLAGDESADHVFYDSHFEEYCVPRPTRFDAAGWHDLRCVPPGTDIAHEIAYLDDACSQPALYARPGNCAADVDRPATALFSMATPSSDPGNPDLVVTDVLRASPGELVTSYFYRASSGCMPAADPIGGVRPVEAVPIGEFAEVHSGME